MQILQKFPVIYPEIKILSIQTRRYGISRICSAGVEFIDANGGGPGVRLAVTQVDGVPPVKHWNNFDSQFVMTTSLQIDSIFEMGVIHGLR